MKKNLVIAEFKEEIDFFKNRQPALLSAPVKVLSLLPETSALLKSRKTPYVTSVDYFTRSSHEKALKRVDTIIDRINHSIEITDSNRVSETYLNALTFHLRQYLSYIILFIEVISNIIDEDEVEQIYACKYKGNDYSRYNLLPKERIAGELAMLFKDRCDIKIGQLTIPDSVKVNAVREKQKKVFSSICNVIEMGLNKTNRKDKILFYSLKYNFDQIAKEFKEYDCFNLAPDQKGLRKLSEFKGGRKVKNIHLNELDNFADEKFFSALTLAKVLIHELHEEEGLFKYKDYDFSSLVFKKIEEGYFEDFVSLNKRIRSLAKILRELKPKLIISPMAREISYALGELSKIYGIPSVLVSHGSHVPPKNDFDRLEWLDHGKGLIETDYRHHLLQSPWAVKYVEAVKARGSYARIEPIIFTRVDRSRKEQQRAKMYPSQRDKRIIVHAGTPKARGSNRLYIYETLDEYIENMKHLVEATRGITDAFLIIRFRPSVYLSLKDLKILLPSGNHYTIATKGSFSDYLTIADLMVSFSSTTIEEALINHIPVLQYDPTGRYTHIEGAKAVDGRFASIDSVYHVDNEFQLKDSLQWIIRNHLKVGVKEDVFKRHVFAEDTAVSINKAISCLLNGEPIETMLHDETQLVRSAV